MAARHRQLATRYLSLAPTAGNRPWPFLSFRERGRICEGSPALAVGRDRIACYFHAFTVHQSTRHGRRGAPLLKLAANDILQRWPVTKRVNSSKAADHDLALIERV